MKPRPRMLYHPYNGAEPYIFLRYDKPDRQAASDIVNILIEKLFRVCYGEYDNARISDSDWLAERIVSSELVIFLISAGALKNFEFRNCINYALSKKKRVFCVYLDDNKLEYGFDMQLSNVPGVKLLSYENIGGLCEDIIKTDCFSQDMRGGDAKRPIISNRKKNIAITAIVSVSALFLTAAAVIAVYRINYEKSFAGQIEKITETDYRDISEEDASAIELLKGKTIVTLVARDMGLSDIEALGSVDCRELDISHNPGINTLEPLLAVENLKTVKVTQDMYPAIVRISGRHRFKIIITG